MSPGFAGPQASQRPSARSGWVPLLRGELADVARGVAEEIAGALARRAPSQELGFKGDAAAALLLAQCGRAEATARLEAALVTAVARPLTISLFGGLAGMAWVLDQLVGTDADAVVEHFDAALCRERLQLVARRRVIVEHHLRVFLDVRPGAALGGEARQIHFRDVHCRHVTDEVAVAGADPVFGAAGRAYGRAVSFGRLIPLVTPHRHSQDERGSEYSRSTHLHLPPARSTVQTR